MLTEYPIVMKKSKEVINVADFLSPDPVGFEQLTVDDTVGGIALTASKYEEAKKASIQVEGASIRVTVNGAPPTLTFGKLYEDGDEIYLESNKEIKQFLAIRATETSATLNVDYSV